MMEMEGLKPIQDAACELLMKGHRLGATLDKVAGWLLDKDIKHVIVDAGYPQINDKLRNDHQIVVTKLLRPAPKPDTINTNLGVDDE